MARVELHDGTFVQSAAVGTFTEAAGGIAAIVLGILGLAGVAAQTLAAVGVVVIGAALLAEGSAILARYVNYAEERGATSEAAEMSGSVFLEFLGGIAVIVLGIVALLGLAPITLLCVSVIAYGGTLILGGGLLAVMTGSSGRENDRGDQVSRVAVAETRSVEVLIGIGGVALGIIALVGINPMTLVLVSIIAYGAAILLTGSAITGRMLSMMSR